MTLKHRIYRLLVNLKRRTSRLLSVIIVFLAALFGLSPSVNAARLYVDGGVEECDNEGDSWGAAFKYLQDALAFASNPQNNIDQIWVAATDLENPYRPDQDCDNPGGTDERALSFQMIAAVEVYGGFFGDELTLEERDIIANETILSGEIGTPSDTDNSGNVVRFFQLTGSPAVLDGFTVRDGYGGGNELSGGGIFVRQTDHTIIRNCTLQDNFALDHGGGVGVSHNQADDVLEIRNSRFDSNVSNEGGGMGYKYSVGEINVINCDFSANVGFSSGGGLYATGGMLTIVNTTFTENTAIDGGGAYFRTGGPGTTDALFINSLFLYNTSTNDGGAVYVTGTDTTVEFVNCTLSKNEADDEGGGIVVANFGSTTITNCILWGNTDGDGNTDLEKEQLLRINPASVTVSYTCIEGLDLFAGNNNIDDNPAFVDEDGSDPDAFDLQDDFRLSLGSLSIDVGDTGAVLCDEFDVDEDGITCDEFDPEKNEDTPDLDLINRVLDGKNDGEAIVDMGAYEFIHPDSCPWDLDDDGVVGVKDLLDLLGNWGPCEMPCPPFCPADFDYDCYVGVKDLLDLLGNWGPCPAFSVEPLSFEDMLTDACLTQENWNAFVAVMDDATASQEDNDNYLCWMEHYLYDCTKCICFGQSGCPSPDPYN